MHKKLIQIDLDGVLNTYTGNYTENKISDIADGAYEFVEKLAKDYTLEIFSVREKSLCKKWLEDNNLSDFFVNITNIKNPNATVFLDDRAVTFNGDFDDAYEKITNFKPFWKK